MSIELRAPASVSDSNETATGASLSSAPDQWLRSDDQSLAVLQLIASEQAALAEDTLVFASRLGGDEETSSTDPTKSPTKSPRATNNIEGSEEEGQTEPATAKRLKKAKQMSKKLQKMRERQIRRTEKLQKLTNLRSMKRKDLFKKNIQAEEVGLQLDSLRGSEAEPAPVEQSQKEPSSLRNRYEHEGWELTGATLTVTLEYEPLALVQTNAFLTDYRVAYNHKESNCGVEGWLYIAAHETGIFERCFCYIQEHPVPSFNICRGAQTIYALEQAALRDKLTVQKINASQLLSLFCCAASGEQAFGMVVDEQGTGGATIHTCTAYRVRASRSDIGRQWLAALRWVADDCMGAFAPKPLPAEELNTSNMARLERNVALLDIPFSRASLLLRHLYDMRVMGCQKPTMRKMVYAIFNLETHAWSTAAQTAVESKGKQSSAPRDGRVRLNELRGLNFYRCVERLALLHYGKARCLSYAEQMREYQTEIRHVSVHLLSTCVSMWVFRRRTGRSVGGYTWPWHKAWMQCPGAYKLALEGLAASRLRSLLVLLKEVRKRKPALMDVELPPKQASVLDRAAESAKDKATGCCARTSSSRDPGLENIGASLGEEEDPSADGFRADGMVSPRSPKSVRREELIELFNWMDTDRSGALDGGEVAAAMSKMRRGAGAMSEDELSELEGVFASLLSVGGDGDIHASDIVIEEEAFVKALTSIATQAQVPVHEDDLDSDLDEFDMGTLDDVQEHYF